MKMRALLPALLLAAVSPATAQTKPAVASTSPANGATNVSRILPCFSVTFSKPKMEKDGWTGIAFVNIESAAAAVKLTAMDASGSQVASATLTLTPGKKYVGMVNQLFTGDLSAARYVKYTSDRLLLGFTVSGSSDGQMLDGLHCLPQYTYQ